MLNGVLGKLDSLSPVKKALVSFALLFTFSLAAYSNSFNAAFHFDDHHQITANHHIRTLSNIPLFFTNGHLSSYSGETSGYRPLTLASFAVNYAISGNDVWSYHVLNYVLHLLAAFLVFLIVSTMLELAGHKSAWPIATFTSLAFALHPVQTYAVTYISGRAVLLATLFYLLAFYGFIRFRNGTGSRTVFIWAALSPFFFYFALLAKEIPVSLIAVMALYDFIVVKPERVSGAAVRALYYVPFLAVLGFFLYTKKRFQGYVAIDTQPYSVWHYLLSETKALLLYIRLLLFPTNQNMDYNFPATLVPDARVALSVLLVSGFVYILWRLRRHKREAAFFGAWFLVALAPESTLVPIKDIVEEYRLYLPSIGFISMLAILMSDALGRSVFFRCLAASVIILFGLLTFNRNLAWATEYSLWSDVARKSPNSSKAHLGLGEALVDEKRYDDAIKELNLSLAMEPGQDHGFYVEYNLGTCYYETGRLNDAASHFERAIRYKIPATDMMLALEKLGDIYFQEGRYQDSARVFEMSGSFVKGNPVIDYNLAISYMMLGRYGESQKELEKTLASSLDNFDVRYNLAKVYEKNGLHAKALEQAEAAAGFAEAEGRQAELAELMARLQKRP